MNSKKLWSLIFLFCCIITTFKPDSLNEMQMFQPRFFENVYTFISKRNSRRRDWPDIKLPLINWKRKMKIKEPKTLHSTKESVKRAGLESYKNTIQGDTHQKEKEKANRVRKNDTERILKLTVRVSVWLIIWTKNFYKRVLISFSSLRSLEKTKKPL